jgi:hypothetical protein
MDEQSNVAGTWEHNKKERNDLQTCLGRLLARRHDKKAGEETTTTLTNGIPNLPCPSQRPSAIREWGGKLGFCPLFRAHSADRYNTKQEAGTLVHLKGGSVSDVFAF